MFTMVSKPRFRWPATVSLPSPDEVGTFTRQSFVMEFEALSRDRADAIDAERNALPPAERAGRSLDWVFEVAKGWRDVVDEAGSAVPWSPDAFRAAMQFPWFQAGVIAAYAEATAGDAARLGN